MPLLPYNVDKKSVNDLGQTVGSQHPPCCLCGMAPLFKKLLGIQIKFKIQTILEPDGFGPFEYQTYSGDLNNEHLNKGNI